jgi:hypothetical protein
MNSPQRMLSNVQYDSGVEGNALNVPCCVEVSLLWQNYAVTHVERLLRRVPFIVVRVDDYASVRHCLGFCMVGVDLC